MFKGRLILFILFFTHFPRIYSQAAPVFILPEKLDQPVFLIEHTSIWHDTSGKATINTVINNALSLFQTQENFEPIKSFPAVIWLKLSISNENDSAQLALMSFDRFADSVWLYEVSQNNVTRVRQTGRSIKVTEKEIISIFNTLIIDLPEKTTRTFYVKIFYRNPVSQVNIGLLILWELKATLGLLYYRYTGQAFYAGIMLMFSLLSFLTYSMFNDRTFINFAFVHLAFIFYFTVINYFFSVFAFNFLFISDFLLLLISISVLILALFNFFSHYLQLKNTSPLYYRFYLIFSIFTIFNVYLYYPFLENIALSIFINNCVILAWIIATIIPVIKLVLKRDKSGINLMISIMVLIVASFIYLLTMMEFLPMNTFTRHSIQIGTIFFSLLLFYRLFELVHYTRKAKQAIQRERDISENLLLNILPAEIAAELKEKGHAEARNFDMVSIMFSDFKGFTELSEKLSAAELVNEINICFKAFDGIMGEHNIEKIKTIGDSYMAVGGLPLPNPDSVSNTIKAAIDMQAFINKRKTENDLNGKPAFEMRVGIHTGPVVAGIVGVKKFQYDVWGDTVNTASRMESCGEAGKVNISHNTYELVKNIADFTFEYRGQIEVKGKGALDMYFVQRRA